MDETQPGTSGPGRAAGTEVDLGIGGLDDVHEIGRGGFGVVYRARQRALNRMVAVKVLGTAFDEADCERVAREAWAMGTLSGHPNIVNVFDVGITATGAQYITMSYLAQGSLGDRLALEGALTWSEAIRIAIKLAGAVEMAHRANTLHRDIKPENVLMSDYGEPQLTDFGIARVEGRFEKATGHFTASVVHAAPEVLDGRAAGVEADIYSLGSTLFTMLAGRPAFGRRSGDSLAGLLARIAGDPLPDLRPRGVPDAVCCVVEQAMAKDAGERQQSAVEFGRQLQEVQRRAGLPVTEMALVLPHTPEAAPTRPAPAGADTADEETEGSARPVPPPGRRPAALRAVAGAVAAVLVVLVVAVVLFGRDRNRDRDAPATSTSVVPGDGGQALAPLPPGGVRVGADPTAIATDPRSGRIYVANSGSLSVSVLDGATKAVVATVALPSRPWNIALNQRTGKVYVTTAESAVTIIDAASNAVTATVPLRSRPWGVAVNHRNNRVYIATSDASVAVVDGDTDKVAATIPVPARPWAVAVIPDADRVYVTSQESTSLFVLDGATAKVAGTVDLGSRACGVAANPRTNRIFVTGLDAGAVTVVDGNSLAVVDTFVMPSKACGVAVNPQTNRVYVSTQATGSVSVIDAHSRTVTATRSLAGPARATENLPNDVDVNPQGESVYVVSKTSAILVAASGDLSPP